MPLVQFNYSYGDGDGDAINYPLPAGVGEEITLSVNLPREAYNKKWILRVVNATSVEQPIKTNFRWVEVRIPELMSEQNIMYSLNSEGSTPEPNRGMRFYVNKYSMDQRAFEPHHLSVTSNPNINMGVHRLDDLRLTCIVGAKSGIVPALVPLYKFTVILEYE